MISLLGFFAITLTVLGVLAYLLTVFAFKIADLVEWVLYTRSRRKSGEKK